MCKEKEQAFIPINEKFKIDFAIPKWLQEDIEELERAIERNDSCLDCFQDNLYSSVNIAQVHSGKGSITREQGDVIRGRYYL